MIASHLSHIVRHLLYTSATSNFNDALRPLQDGFVHKREQGTVSRQKSEMIPADYDFRTYSTEWGQPYLNSTLGSWVFSYGAMMPLSAFSVTLLLLLVFIWIGCTTVSFSSVI